MTKDSQGTLGEKLEGMQRDLADIARRLNLEGDPIAALAVQETIVALGEAKIKCHAFREYGWNWEPEPLP